MPGRKIHKVFDLQDVLLIDKIGEGFVLSKDGSLTAGFRVNLLPLNCASVGDFIYDSSMQGKQLQSLLERAIKGLPYGTIFHQQDVVFYNKNNDLPNNDDYLNLAVRRFYGERAVMDNKSYMFITKKGLLFNGNKLNFDKPAIARFIDSVNQFKAAIDVLEPYQLQDADWVEYYQSLFSADFSDNINKTLEEIDFKARKFGSYNLRGFAIVGDTAASHIEACTPNMNRGTSSNPRYNSWVYPLLWDVPCFKIINNIIYRADEKYIRSNISDFESKMGLFKRLAPGTMEAIVEYRELTESEEFTPIFHHFNAFYLLPDCTSSELKDIESHIDKAFIQMEARPERLTVDLEDTFLATVPGCTGALQAPNQLAYSFLDEAICFSNLEGGYTQYQNGIVLADTKGFPVVADVIFEPRRRDIISNNNWIIIGPSGTGKSVFTNKFVSSYLPQDFFFFIIDIGGSYRTLVSLHKDKARYIELDPEGKNLSFNPFLIDMIDPQDDPEHRFEEEMNTLIELLFIAWNPNEDLHVRDENSTQTLRNLLTEFYTERFKSRRTFVKFDTFYAFVEEKNKKNEINKSFFDVDSFLHVTARYLSKEALGYLFNGEKNIFDYRGLSMIVFELEKISEQSKTIYRLITFMLINMATNIINNAPFRMKFLWLDEAWRLLQASAFELFIKQQFKTIRKKGGGVGVITQEVLDIVGTTYGANIIGSSGSFAYLSHEGKESQLKQYQNQLSLSNENLSLILSMKNQNHEVAIIQGGELGRVFRVQLSPEELAAFNTTKQNIIKRQALINKYAGNVQLALNEYVAKK